MESSSSELSPRDHAQTKRHSVPSIRPNGNSTGGILQGCVSYAAMVKRCQPPNLRGSAARHRSVPLPDRTIPSPLPSRRCNRNDGNDGGNLGCGERHKSKCRTQGTEVWDRKCGEGDHNRGPQQQAAGPAAKSGFLCSQHKHNSKFGQHRGDEPRSLKRGLVGVKDQEQDRKRQQVEDRADQPEDDHER